MCSVQKQESKGKWIISLDLQKALDFVHPVLATAAFKELGMSEDLSATLLSMWSHQKRRIALGKTVACSPCEVGSSLQQGGGMSPLAMNAVLSAAVRAVERPLHAVESKQQRKHMTLTGRRQLWTSYRHRLRPFKVQRFSCLYHFHLCFFIFSSFFIQKFNIFSVPFVFRTFFNFCFFYRCCIVVCLFYHSLFFDLCLCLPPG